MLASNPSTSSRFRNDGRSKRLCRSYILGAMHDGTVREKTIRISQKERSYVLMIRQMIRDVGGSAWVYREGKNRQLFVVEFSRSFISQHFLETKADYLAYVRGYFDAEGGVPACSTLSPYIYFAQKNRRDLRELRGILLTLGIACGRLHNPSKASDPSYWRFYIRACSHRRFSDLIGSWHPRKAAIVEKLRAKVEREAPAPLTGLVG